MEKQTKAIGIRLSSGRRTDFSLCHQAPSLGPQQGESIPPFPGLWKSRAALQRGEMAAAPFSPCEQQPPLPPCSSTASPAPSRAPRFSQHRDPLLPQSREGSGAALRGPAEGPVTRPPPAGTAPSPAPHSPRSSSSAGPGTRRNRARHNTPRPAPGSVTSRAPRPRHLRAGTAERQVRVEGMLPSWLLHGSLMAPQGCEVPHASLPSRSLLRVRSGSSAAGPGGTEGPQWRWRRPRSSAAFRLLA